MSAISAVTMVRVEPLDTERFASVITLEQYRRFEQAIRRARPLFAERVIWNVNSTARGGGVAEMLRSLISYARGAGVDARWAVIAGTEDYFRVTKRIHNHLHGAVGDGDNLGNEQRELYEAALRPSAEELTSMVAPDDIVIIHDPQPAGLISPLRDKGATVLWRCHVGLDFPNDLARRAWSFLIPYVAPADAYIFSREAFAWEGLDPAKITVIRPSIDAFSPKNQELDGSTVRAILSASGTIADGAEEAEATFVRRNGSVAEVVNQTSFSSGHPVPAAARLVVQVSRWDRLKDPVGVMEGFVARVAPRSEAHLVLAGPAVEAVSDDPEGKEVLDEATARWESLSAELKERVHLASLPMEDAEQNAAIVNALQRHAEVVVQKSIAEGFGLTVAEAMWKGRPVVASRIGGIQDQIEHGKTGLLIDDPHDLRAFGDAVTELLDDDEGAKRMGREAQMRVRDEFLGPRHLMQYVDLIGRLIAPPTSPTSQ